MGAATTIAITSAAVANANAAAAAQEAHAAKVIACRGYVQQFQSQEVTIEAQLQYADCVNLLHPRRTEAEALGTVIGLKIAIILAMVGLVLGSVYQWKEARDVPMACMGGILMAILLPLAVGAIAALGYGVYWVFA